MDWQERIIVDPKILVGKPVVKGTRLAVEFIVELLAQGWAESEILRNYPGLTHDDIAACLKYATSILKAEGIDVVLIEDSISQSTYANPFAPVQVFVPKEGLQQARELMETFDEAEDSSEDEGNDDDNESDES